MKKTEKYGNKPEKENIEKLIKQAHKLEARNFEFVVRRNTKNLETGEISPGKLERGWRILNINNDGLVTLYNDKHSEGGIFHIPIKQLQELNEELFNLADSLE